MNSEIFYVNKWIWKNPDVGFRRPCIVGTGISTRVIANRINAGEAISSVASDYELPVEAIEAACEYEKYRL